jgi:hypothetical protein
METTKYQNSSILNEKIINDLLKLFKYNYDCMNKILELSGFKNRNGKYINQLNKFDFRYSILENMPKIKKISLSEKNTSYYEVVINKRNKNINYSLFISTSIYSNKVHWYMDMKINEISAPKISMIHYIFRNHDKANKPCKNY